LPAPSSFPVSLNSWIAKFGVLLSVCVGGFSGCTKPIPPERTVLHEKYWDGVAFTKKPLFDRVVAPTPELMDHLRFYNRKGGRSEPTATGIGPQDLNTVKWALAKLPRKLLIQMNEKLVTVSIVNELGSSGYSNFVADKEGYPTHGFVVIDKRLLSETPNEWITRKESSPFRCFPTEQIDAKLGDEEKDGMAALQYVLVHEFAHVLSETLQFVNPYYNEVPKQSELDSREFGPMSWRVADSHYVSKFDAVFPHRNKLRYYSRAPSSFSCGDANLAFSQLEKTNFPTLYSALDPFEDFAESFANFIHVSVMNRPYVISVLREGKIVHQYHACWNESRCAEKKKYLEKMYAGFFTDGK
jgi:hypothetical protein